MSSSSSLVKRRLDGFDEAGLLTPDTERAALVFQDGTRVEGISFGARCSVAGEAVFNTGMVGYPGEYYYRMMAMKICVYFDVNGGDEGLFWPWSSRD
jgi:hypothetical protein